MSIALKMSSSDALYTPFLLMGLLCDAGIALKVGIIILNSSEKCVSGSKKSKTAFLTETKWLEVVVIKITFSIVLGLITPYETTTSGFKSMQYDRCAGHNTDEQFYFDKTGNIFILNSEIASPIARYIISH